MPDSLDCLRTVMRRFAQHLVRTQTSDPSLRLRPEITLRAAEGLRMTKRKPSSESGITAHSAHY